jgi:Sulfotransferase family
VNTTGSDNTPFFVLGAARSGTTMLRLMLNRHSRLTIPFESHFLVHIFAELPSDRPLKLNEADRMADLVVGEKNFQTWHLDPTSVRQKMRQLAPAPLAVLVDALYRMEVADSGKPRWGDKTPHYYKIWRNLTRLFPTSKLIHIIRDGRDVVRSLEQVAWHGPTNVDRARYWQERVELALAAARELGSERNLIVRYEELVLETRSTLAAICDFLGESFEPEMPLFFEDASKHICDIDGDVHGKLGRQPQPEDVGRWRHEMSVEDQIRFEAVAGAGLRSMSYPCRFANQDSPAGSSPST